LFGEVVFLLKSSGCREPPVADQFLPFEQLPDAMSRMRARITRGRMVLNMASTSDVLAGGEAGQQRPDATSSRCFGQHQELTAAPSEQTGGLVKPLVSTGTTRAYMRSRPLPKVPGARGSVI